MSIVVREGTMASRHWAMLAVFLACCISFAVGDAPVTLDGNRLLPQCEDAVRVANDSRRGLDADASYCLGFVNGIMEMAYDWQASTKQSKLTFLPCLPSDGMTSMQAVRIVTKYLNSHPEKLHRDAKNLVVEALKEAFPCK
jgi:hypothetical protein